MGVVTGARGRAVLQGPRGAPAMEPGRSEEESSGTMISEFRIEMFSRKAFAGGNHGLTEFVEFLDQIDLLVDGKIRETGAPLPLRGQDFLQRLGRHESDR